MAAPPRDKNGVVLPHDDLDIADDDGLLRHIDPQYHICWDDNLGRKRLSSVAFKESQKNAPHGGMSVDIESLVVADNIAPADRAKSKNGLVRLPTGSMRALKFKVGSDPIHNDPEYPDNPYHGEVWGIGKQIRKKSIFNAVIESCQWVKKIKGVE